MIDKEYKFSELTSKIIGLSMKVHSALGNGFQEVIYQRALAFEFNESGITFTREKQMPVYYRGRQIGLRRADFLAENSIAVELKSVTELNDHHLAQAINYLECYALDVGLLINFGAKSLQFRRLGNNNLRQKKQGNPLV